MANEKRGLVNITTGAAITDADARYKAFHGIVSRPVGVTNPLPTNITIPIFTLGTTANPLSYYYLGTLINVTTDKTVTLNDDTGPITTSGSLIAGNHYKINTYVAGDNFSNIATTLTGTVNTTGYEFTATGTGIPTTWSNGSTVQRIGMPGLYFIYFNTDTGNILQGGFPGLTGSANPILAIVKWNGTDFGLIGDERHGYTRDRDWHLWAHDTVGVRWESGITLTASGSNLTAILATTLGVIHDEDLEFAVPASSTFTTANSCRQFWQTSATTYVFDKVLRTYPFKPGTSNRPIYIDSSNAYAQTTLPPATNRFINVFFYVTTDLYCPIYMFVETSTAALVLNGYTTLANARAIPFPNLSNKGLSPELKPIYRVIIDGNGLVQTITSADDYRNVSSLPQAAGNATTTAAAVTFTPYGNIAAGNVQTALEEIDDEKLIRSDFNTYSGLVNVAQHTQDLAITGKVSTSTYTAGQHTQDLAITGKMLRSDFNTYSGLINVAQHTQDLAITGKVSTSTYNVDQHSQDLAITGKVSTSTYTVGQHIQDLAITGKMTNVTPSTSGNILTSNGTIWQSSAPAIPITITVADESTDTTCYPLFVTAATGNLAPKTNSALCFNAATYGVGMGDVPLAGYVLNAYGSIRVWFNIVMDGHIYAITSNGSVDNASYSFVNDADTGMFSSGNNTLNFTTTGVERLRITSTGNVGIGTTTPYTPLQIATSNATTSNPYTDYSQAVIFTNTDTTVNNWASIGFSQTIAGGFEAGMAAQFTSRTAGARSTDLVFVTENVNVINEKMRILANGNVGIGTTSPDVKLAIRDTAAGNVTPGFSVGNSNYKFAIYMTGDSYSTNTGLMDMPTSSNPNYPVFFSNSPNTFYFGNYSNADLKIGTNNLVRMTIKNDGNVGIGTTSPTAKLHIAAGTATASTAPLKFTSGALLSTPEAGTLQYLTDTFYITGTDNLSVNGKIGVGTALPEADLHIVSGAKDDVGFKVSGTQGELFSVTDNLDTLLQSVNDISGMPVWEVYADDRVVAYGTFQGSLKTTPATPSVNSYYSYFFATGTTPNRVVGVALKLEDGSEFIVASSIV